MIVLTAAEQAYLRHIHEKFMAGTTVDVIAAAIGSTFQLMANRVPEKGELEIAIRAAQQAYGQVDKATQPFISHLAVGNKAPDLARKNSFA